MRRRRGEINWYELVFAAFAALIVFPDVVLHWFEAKTGKTVTWLHLVFLEALAIGGLVAFTAFVMESYPMVAWWHPVLIVAALGMFRMIQAFVSSMFD